MRCLQNMLDPVANFGRTDSRAIGLDCDVASSSEEILPFNPSYRDSCDELA